MEMGDPLHQAQNERKMVPQPGLTESLFLRGKKFFKCAMLKDSVSIEVTICQ